MGIPKATPVDVLIYCGIACSITKSTILVSDREWRRNGHQYVNNIPPLNEESKTLAGRSRKKVVVTADVASTPLSAMQCEDVLPGITEAIKNEADGLYQPLIQIDEVVVISDDEDELERVKVKEEVEESERVEEILPPSYRNRTATLQSCVVNSSPFCIVLSDDEEDSGLGI